MRLLPSVHVQMFRHVAIVVGLIPALLALVDHHLDLARVAAGCRLRRSFLPRAR
jgi:hypothetical protein